MCVWFEVDIDKRNKFSVNLDQLMVTLRLITGTFIHVEANESSKKIQILSLIFRESAKHKTLFFVFNVGIF